MTGGYVRVGENCHFLCIVGVVCSFAILLWHGHCMVCPYSIYVSEYPFGGLQAFLDTVHSIHLNVHHMDQ